MDITQNVGRSACLPIVTASYWCPLMSSKYVTTHLVSVSARSLPRIFMCPLSLCSIVGSSHFILYWSVETMAVVSGL